MARACGLSQTTVNRIWRLHGLAPHQPGQAAASPEVPIRPAAGPVPLTRAPDEPGRS